MFVRSKNSGVGVSILLRFENLEKKIREIKITRYFRKFKEQLSKST